MLPNLYLSGAFGLAFLAVVGYAYFKGETNCANSYEVKILRSKVKNQEIKLKMFSDANLEATKLSTEALKQVQAQDEKYDKLLKSIKTTNSNATCVDADFLRGLERTRK